MIRIIGDEIEYAGRVVARFIVPSFDTWRNRATDDLEDCDPDRVEKERDDAIAEIEKMLQDEITGLKNDLATVTEERDALEKIVEALDGGATCAELIAAAQAYEAKWREIAETNRAAYYEAIKPKPRKRKVTP
jgi:hypothetical protein